MRCLFMIQRHHHHSRFVGKLRRCFQRRIKELPTSHPTMEPRLHMWMILKERSEVFHLVSLRNNGHIVQYLKTQHFGMIHFQKQVIFIEQRPIGIKTSLVQLPYWKYIPIVIREVVSPRSMISRFDSKARNAGFIIAILNSSIN